MDNALEVAGRSEDLLGKAENIAREITLGQYVIEQRFVQLGEILLEIKAGSLWKNAGFLTYGGYLNHLSRLVAKERSSLYNYTGVVEHLLPVVGRESLEKIGINKALVLTRGMKYSGKHPSPDLIATGENPHVTTAQFQAEVHEEFRIFVPTEDGTYRKLEFYASDDEWAELQQAMEVAKRVGPVSNKNPDTYQTKEILIMWAQEFVSSHLPGASK